MSVSYKGDARKLAGILDACDWGSGIRNRWASDGASELRRLSDEIDAQRDLLAKAAGDLDAVALDLGVRLTPRETLVERCSLAIRLWRAETEAFRKVACESSEAVATWWEEAGGDHLKAAVIRSTIARFQGGRPPCPDLSACQGGCIGSCRPDTDGAWPMPLACAFSDACPDGCRGTCQTTIGDAA